MGFRPERPEDKQCWVHRPVVHPLDLEKTIEGKVEAWREVAFAKEVRLVRSQTLWQARVLLS